MIADKSRVKGCVRNRVYSFPTGTSKQFLSMREKYEKEGNYKAVDVFDKTWLKKRQHKSFWMFLSSIWASRFNLKDTIRSMKYEFSVNHNIVTDEGDALIADLMQQTPARTKVDNTNGRIVVGTGWTGTTPKTNTWVNTQTGSPEAMDATYPKLKGSWGAANDNVVQYRSTFEAGDLNASGINEAALVNAATDPAADCLAYAQITPSANVGPSDTLQVDWEITLLGA